MSNFTFARKNIGIQMVKVVHKKKFASQIQIQFSNHLTFVNISNFL
jgi:hypothetical protein